MAQEREETSIEKFERKLGKLIKHAKRNKGMLWYSVVDSLENARADVKSMVKVHDSGPR